MSEQVHDYLNYDKRYEAVLMAVRKIVGACRKIEYIGGKKLAPYFDEVSEHAESLKEIVSWKDLKHEFCKVESLKASSKSSASWRKIELKRYFLKTDIEAFYHIFGDIFDDLFKDFSSARDSSTEIEDCNLVSRFCTNVHDLYESWEELYLRMRALEEMIQPKGKVIFIEEDPLDQLLEINLNSTFFECPFLGEMQLRERLMDMRRDNRKLNLILRESDFELSDVELNRLKFVKKVVASKDAEEGILTSASRDLKLFERRLTKFRIKTKGFRLRNVQKCLKHEETFMEFLSTENVFKPNLKHDLTIAEKMTEFFEKVFNDYQMYTSELYLLKIEFKKHWDYYM